MIVQPVTRFLAVFVFLILPLFAQALAIETRLEDPAQEARAQVLFKALRCVACTSESINDSKADIAVTLRRLVRKRIETGDSDVQILDYVTQRYGDAVLMSPPVKPATYLLWFGPVMLFVAGLVAFGIYIRKMQAKTDHTPYSG